MNFWGNFQKYCGIDQINCSALANELINIFDNAFVATAVILRHVFRDIIFAAFFFESRKSWN